LEVIYAPPPPQLPGLGSKAEKMLDIAARANNKIKGVYMKLWPPRSKVVLKHINLLLIKIRRAVT
jgi:hypothetical protein